MQAMNPIETLAGAMAHAAYQAFPEYVYKDRDWAKHDAWRATLSREEMKTAAGYDVMNLGQITAGDHNGRNNTGRA